MARGRHRRQGPAAVTPITMDPAPRPVVETQKPVVQGEAERLASWAPQAPAAWRAQLITTLGILNELEARLAQAAGVSFPEEKINDGLETAREDVAHAMLQLIGLLGLSRPPHGD